MSSLSLAFQVIFIHAPAIMKHRSGISAYLSPVYPKWSARNQQARFAVPLAWRSSLYHIDSLTAQLIEMGEGDFRVEVLKQAWRRLSRLECRSLGLSSPCSAWCRDVALWVADQPVVYARTCIPSSTLSGAEKQLRHLDRKPLGAYLFKHPAMRRGKMSSYRCQPNALSLQWARRSVFYLHDKPLLVTEAFVRPVHG